MITKGGSALMLVGELKALEDGSYGSYLFISLSSFCASSIALIQQKVGGGFCGGTRFSVSASNI